MADIKGDHNVLLPALMGFVAEGVTRNNDPQGVVRPRSGAHYPGGGGA